MRYSAAVPEQQSSVRRAVRVLAAEGLIEVLRKGRGPRAWNEIRLTGVSWHGRIAARAERAPAFLAMISPNH